MKKFTLFAILMLFILTLSVGASNKLSPAIDIIAGESQMIKTAVPYNGEINFDISDFDYPLGINVGSITVTALPDERVGRLMLGNLYVVQNQVIYRDDFSMLKFVQIVEDEAEATFKFKPNNSDYEIVCSLKSLKNVNLSPVATNGESVSAWTNMNISSFGVLAGYDPEGDDLTFEIVSYPKKGLIQITNSKAGDYKYTPYYDAKGIDVFSYRVRDSYGNYSELCTVELKIEKLRTSLVFSDIKDERYLNAIFTMCEHKLMTYRTDKDGNLFFAPDDEITKEEFVSLVMTAMGAKNVPTIERTRFADDKEISDKYKGYLEAAFSLGILAGENRVDGVYINPKSAVTTADASIIINKIIGATSKASISVFIDADEIPDKAKDSIASLTEIGVLTKTNGKISPNSPLTRSQAAQILMSLLQFNGKLK